MRRGGIIVVIALVVAACSGDDDNDGKQAAEKPPVYEPTFETAPCTDPVPDDPRIECGTLVVPEDREKPSGRTVRLPVAIIRSDEAKRAPDPIVWFEGGPGYSGLRAAEFLLERDFGGPRDVILFDQRGTGRAEPNLDCPETHDIAAQNSAEAQSLEVESGRTEAAMLACRTRLVDSGVDLDAYGTPESAADVGDLRVALGIEEWNLYGLSYGTRLALEVMRSHSEGVRSAVLDSVLPTTVDQLSQRGTVEQLERVLGLLAETCAADPTCSSAYPNPLGDLDAVVAKYEADPFEGEITNPVTGRRVPITVTGQDIVGGAYQAFYDTTLIPLLPLFTRQLLAGETGIIPPLAERALQDGTAQAEGMAESVNCSDTARIRAEADSADIAALVAEHPTWEQFIGTEGSSCDRWDVEPAPDGFNDPVRSDIRTLVLAGEFDPTTPPAWSKAAAEKLSNATYVEFPGLGHVTLYAHDCPVAIFSSFLDEPNRAVDTTCVDQMPGVKFTTP